jgi:hypothetical protein
MPPECLPGQSVRNTVKKQKALRIDSVAFLGKVYFNQFEIFKTLFFWCLFHCYYCGTFWPWPVVHSDPAFGPF